MRPLLALFALLICFSLCTIGARAVSYEYDRTAPLEMTTEDTHAVAGGVRVDDVSFQAPGRVVHAALVMPKDPGGSMPGVLFVHWLGDPATSNRNEFLPDAEWLARRGVVSLVPDQPWAAPHWFDRTRSTATDERDSIAEVIVLRRSLDALIATPGVDPRAIAYVGHDFGAMYGALLAGVDTRPSFYVFMAPATSLAAWFLLDTERPPADAAAYAARINAFDIRAALARATFRACLLQFAAHDEYVPKSDAEAFAAAVPQTNRTARTYATDHALAVDAATDERRDWLANQFRL
jgi:cephalosporin-C deacetylase-like acetyl esterase